MDNYIAQKHLEIICKAQQIANTEMRRIKEYDATYEGAVEFAKWNKVFIEDNRMIENYIHTLEKEGIQIILSEKETVYALIYYYVGNLDADFNLVNLDKKFADIYPKDKACEKFLQGYMERNFGPIYDAFDMIY